MKYFHLIWAALCRRKTRTVFTLMSVLTAFLLFGLLDSVRAGFAGAASSVAGVDRLVTISKVSFTLSLPKNLLARIQSTPGVSDVAYATWFGGVYQDTSNFFPNQAVSDNFFDLYPEYVISTEQQQTYNKTRTGAVVGKSLADRFGWKVGDKIPLSATIFPQLSGSNTWTFDLVGIFKVADESQHSKEGQMFFHWDYFDEARAFDKSSIGWFIEKVADVGQTDRVVRAIDLISANSDHETKTESEQAWQVSFVNQFADIGLIVSAIMVAVFFTLILLTGNTMTQAVRERVPELAVLKTIGFSNNGVLGLVLAESVLLILIGGVIGLLLAGLVVSQLKAAVGSSIPISSVGWTAWLRALALMLAIGAGVGWLPALRGMRLRIVDALSGR